MVADPETQAAIDTYRFAQLAIKSAENVSPWRRIRLRVVLAKDFGVDASLLLNVIAERKRLLTTIGASGRGLAVRLYEGAIQYYVEAPFPPVVMIQQKDELLAVALDDTCRCCRKLGLVLNS